MKKAKGGKARLRNMVGRIMNYGKVPETIDRKGGDSVRQGVHRIHGERGIQRDVEGFVHVEQASFEPDKHGVRTMENPIGYGRSATTKPGIPLGMREKNRKGAA